MIRHILKFILSIIVFSQLLMISICFENMILRVGIVILTYLLSFLIVIFFRGGMQSESKNGKNGNGY